MRPDQLSSCVPGASRKKIRGFSFVPAVKRDGEAAAAARPPLHSEKLKTKWASSARNSLPARQIDLSLLSRAPPSILKGRRAGPGEQRTSLTLFSVPRRERGKRKKKENNKSLSLEKNSTCFYRRKSLFFHEVSLCSTLIDYSGSLSYSDLLGTSLPSTTIGKKKSNLSDNPGGTTRKFSCICTHFCYQL